jgi:hypothetical protein
MPFPNSNSRAPEHGENTEIYLCALSRALQYVPAYDFYPVGLLLGGSVPRLWSPSRTRSCAHVVALANGRPCMHGPSCHVLIHQTTTRGIPQFLYVGRNGQSYFGGKRTLYPV